MFDDIFETLQGHPSGCLAPPLIVAKGIKEAVSSRRVLASIPEVACSGKQAQPFDLSEKIGPWIRHCQALATSMSLEEVLSSLEEIEERRCQAEFRLAYVGEFSRGKSTLINRLFARPLLPVRAVPTLLMPTSIRSGPVERMEVLFEGGHWQERPLQKSSWDDLLIPIEPAAGKTGAHALTGIKVTVHHQWLAASKVELIDTPGVGEGDGQRTALVLDVLSLCDAVVLVVNGAMPFSMTEQEFLKREVIGRHVPQVLVVVSKLDTFEPQDRADVLATVCERVHQVTAAIPVLPSHPVDESAAEDATLETIRAQIDVMIERGERRVWRNRHIAEQLVQTIFQMREMADTALSALHLSDEARAQELQAMQVEIQTAQTRWNSVRIELEHRCQRCGVRLRQEMAGTKLDLIETLFKDMFQTPDPKGWWELTLPYRMQHELAVKGNKFRNSLLEILAQDWDWLQGELSLLFAVQMPRPLPDLVPEEVLAGNRTHMNEAPALELADIPLLRLLTKIGSSTLMIGSHLFAAPAAIVTIAKPEMGLSSVIDQLIDRKLAQQRKVIARHLESAIDHAIEEYCERVSERLQGVYLHLLQETQSGEAAWRSARSIGLQNTAMQSSATAPQEQAWRQLRDESIAVRDEIVAALKHSPPF